MRAFHSSRKVLLLAAVTTLLVCGVTMSEDAQASDLKAPLPLSRISAVTVSGRTKLCALFRGRTKWRPAKRVRGSVYKAVSGTRQHRNACAAVGALGSVTLAEIPGVEQLFRANSSSLVVDTSAVSGTPPVLAEIPNGSTKEVFWRPGVIDGLNSGAPTNTQCSELFDSPTDGTSGGFNACYMTMNAGEAFSNVLRSGTTLCYMKRALSDEGLRAGVLALVSGSFPSGDVNNLATPPSGSGSRIVKVDAVGDEGTSSIFLRIYGSATNSSNGDSYRFDFWSCDSGPEGTPSEIETTRITTAGVYTSSGRGNSEMLFSSTVQAFLTRVGDSLVFDTTRPRTADVVSNAGDGTQIGKSSLEIDGSNIVRVKRYLDFTTETNKSYSIARVTGSSLAELRFLDGAFNEAFTRTGVGSFSHTGGIEYRDTFYASAPANSFVPSLSSVDLTTDPFYASLTPVSFDSTGFSCSAVPDVRVSLNLASPAFAPIQTACEGTRLDGMDFCRDSEISDAVTNYFAHCLD